MDSRRGMGRRSGDAGAVPPTKGKKRCGEAEQDTEQYLPELSASKHAEAPSYYGVVWHEFNSKWEAHVNMDNKQRFLGYYATEEDARMHGAAALRLQSQPSKPSFAPAGQDMLPPLLSPQKGTSQFRGVSWNQASGKWRAQLCHGEAVYHLGYFESEVEAAHEYDRNALRLKGQNATTNFPAGEYGARQNDPGHANSDVGQSDSQYLGVSWDERSRGWISELWDGQRYKLLGTFKGEKDAARAYDGACTKMYGPAAIINFPVPLTRARKEGRTAGSKEAELELAAMEALASMSSNMEDGTHYDTSPRGTTDAQLAGSPKCGLPAVRRDAPEARAVTLQPTPSPYQDSNCEHDPCSDGHIVHELADLAAGKLCAQGLAGLDEEPCKSSLFRGVSWHKHSQKWYAYIQHAGKMRGLGYFHSQQDAAAVYDAEAVKVHGRKAVLNFPPHSKDMSAPPARGVHLTRAKLATLPEACPAAKRGAPEAQSQGIKWNPADERYHVFVWDEDLDGVRSIGNFESKSAAVRALHTNGEGIGPPMTLRSGSQAAGCTAEASRCNSFVGRSATVSPFSKAAQQPSDTGDVTQVHTMTLEPASSIKSPLKLPPQDAAPAEEEAQGFAMGALDDDLPTVPPEGAGHRRFHSLLQPLPMSRALPHSSESDDSSAGVVGNSWGQGSWLPADVRRSRSEELDCGKSRAATLRHSDLVPASRSGSPIPQPRSLPPRQAGRKRGRAAATGGTALDQAPTGARLQSRGSSKYKGVSWSERSSKWRAQMWFGNKVHHLGFFDSEEAAARCYDTAVLELRGPGAPTNFEPADAAPGSAGLKPSVLQSLTSASLPKVTSKYRGVRWHYCNSKWEARIFNGTRQISLGYYDNEVEAAAAYDAEARGLRGAAAVVNFRTAKPAATAKTAAAATAAATAAAVRPPTRRQPQPKTDENHNDDDDYLPAPPSRWGRKKRRF